jgi:hypothetical protein
MHGTNVIIFVCFATKNNLIVDLFTWHGLIKKARLLSSFLMVGRKGLFRICSMCSTTFRLEPDGSHPFMYCAERKGFEPPIHFRRIHAFQACSLNHSDTSPFRFDCENTYLFSYSTFNTNHSTLLTKLTLYRYR